MSATQPPPQPEGDVPTPTTETTWQKWKPKTTTQWAIAIIVVCAIIFLLVLPGLVHYGMLDESFAGPFSLWGTPDWEIRNKGHMHQERSDADVSKPKKGQWSIAAFKKSVRDLNRKANM